jgi:hypothetical protein
MSTADWMAWLLPTSCISQVGYGKKLGFAGPQLKSALAKVIGVAHLSRGMVKITSSPKTGIICF